MTRPIQPLLVSQRSNLWLAAAAGCWLVAAHTLAAAESRPRFRLAALGARVSAERLPQTEPEVVPLPGPAEVLASEPLELGIPTEKVAHLPITYRVAGHLKRRCAPVPMTKMVLLVEDPHHCGCYVEVPLCIPTCCSDPPQMDSHSGILGRRMVNYDWSSGFSVKVLFRTRGDLVVTYYL